MTGQRSTASPGCSLAVGLAFGAVFALAGGYILAISLNLIPVDPERFKAPRLVVAAAGMVFLLAGTWVAFQTASPFAQDTPLFRWTQYFLMLIMMGAFAVVFLWAGFGPGERQFETSTSLGVGNATGSGDEAGGGCIFGGFGLLAALGVLYYAVTQPGRILRSKAPPGDKPSREGPPDPG
jgi:peptidoglycan/LPS O-acetylase OafA/YrhL